jgi:dTMP kinase
MDRLTGKLIVIEGPDSSGRTTHIGMLTEWLEEQGYSVVHVGLRKSMLVAPELDQAKQGNVLGPRTMSLFYAADFYDQMENVMIPALRSGSVVLADRYIFTLMARDLARGGDPKWLESLYSLAVVPDAVFFLSIPAVKLAARALQAHGTLDYWESGMDIGLSHDRYDSFIKYQKLCDREFRKMASKYGFHILQAEKPAKAIQKELRQRVGDELLQGLRTDQGA